MKKNKKTAILIIGILVVIIILAVALYRGFNQYGHWHYKISIESSENINGIGKITAYYKDPVSAKEFVKNSSLFAIDMTQRIQKETGVKTVEFNILTDFTNNDTGAKLKDTGMWCSVKYNNVAAIELDGYETLLYSNCLKLQDVADVKIDKAIEDKLE